MWLGRDAYFLCGVGSIYVGDGKTAVQAGEEAGIPIGPVWKT